MLARLGFKPNNPKIFQNKSYLIFQFFSLRFPFRYFGKQQTNEESIESVSDDVSNKIDVPTKPPFDSFRDLRDVIATLHKREAEDKSSKQSTYESDSFPTMGDMLALSPS